MPEGYHKLVRDKIPEHLDAKGISYEQTTATPEEYRKRLLEKLAEEVKEFLDARNSEELADILEVIEALKKLPKFKNVEEVKKKKLAEKGGFEKRVILKGKK
ncbi:MAG: nucleoside triphosphate pyrophosphohydrolase [Candidatus Paceibacterota bacterium]